MEETQVGNAEADINSAPESFISDDSSDFFAELDKSVNGGIIDDADANETSIDTAPSDNTQENEAPSLEEAQTEDVETLKKRYADSSS